ncbi:Fur family transcriptional regulator [Rubritalea spongiae]|uniref:Fur family transcriptional regulator n=1 Tax=Rubritalea spongiae TaxID=430797 RepID=A0ABW5E0G4_9BACT
MSHSTVSIIAQCKAAGLRRTKALELLIDTLLASPRPMTLAELSEHDNLNTQCDRATVFRLLQRLTDKGIVRRLGLHERAAYFTLLLTGRHQDFLICTDCGKIEAINAQCPVHALEKEIAQKSGFTGLYHELEFFGTCPKCSV